MPELHALVVAGGQRPHRALADALPEHHLVVAADSGLDHARELGLRVTHVIGDMDSVDPRSIAEAERDGAVVQRVPHDKDQVDTELAILFARTLGATAITLVTAGGGRLDHQLGVMSTLTHPILHGCEVHAVWDLARVRVLNGPESATITGQPNTLVGLVAMNGVARGITTEGLRWALADEDLESHSTRGVSNELIATQATIEVRSGHLFVIQPHAHDSLMENS
jgi:thiamine pyrophosphokinase